MWKKISELQAREGQENQGPKLVNSKDKWKQSEQHLDGEWVVNSYYIVGRLEAEFPAKTMKKETLGKG